MPWTAHIDGGSRGNPGPAAAGVVLKNEAGKPVLSAGFFLGRLTNNQAEYQGLLHALRLLERAGARQIQIVSDSELMVRQINGQYRVKSPDLRPLYQEAMSLLDGFQWKMRHTLREGNTDADGLANEAMDARRDVVQMDTMGISGETAPSASAGKTRSPTAVPGPGLFSHDAETRSGPKTVCGKVIQAPGPDACPAKTRQGQTFECSTVMPGAICLHLGAVVAPAIIELQEQSMPEERRVRCGKTGCRATVELRSE